MAGIDVFQIAVTAKNAKKHGAIFCYLGAFTQEIAEMIKYARRIGSHGHTGKRALEHGCKQRAAPRPLPETSAMRKAVRSFFIGNTSK